MIVSSPHIIRIVGLIFRSSAQALFAIEFSTSAFATRRFASSIEEERKKEERKVPRFRSHVFICPSEPRLITAPQANNCKPEFGRRLESNLSAATAHNELCNHNATPVAYAIIPRENVTVLSTGIHCITCFFQRVPSESKYFLFSIFRRSHWRAGLTEYRLTESDLRILGIEISLSLSDLAATDVPNVTALSRKRRPVGCRRR